jgi:hypothetical protein
MQINVISHPLAVDKIVRVNRPSCKCRGAKMETVQGTIKKVITNQAGIWYYLGNIGITVKADWVIEVL